MVPPSSIDILGAQIGGRIGNRLLAAGCGLRVPWGTLANHDRFARQTTSARPTEMPQKLWKKEEGYCKSVDKDILEESRIESGIRQRRETTTVISR
jgi:hypothetical protein